MSAESVKNFVSCGCGGRLVRVHRRMWQRFVYAAVYRCVDCGQKQARRRSTFTFSRVSLCPRCGTEKLRVRRKRDQIDKMSTSMVSRVQHILGGELHHCEFCRLQFYDFRKVAADNHRKS